LFLTLTEERFFRLCLQADLFLIFYNDCRGLLKAVFLIAFNVIPLFFIFLVILSCLPIYKMLNFVVK
jgi:hypothetical protein